MEQGLTIADYPGVFRRRAWILALAIVIGSFLALGIAYLLPPVYRSTAKILIESQQIPSDLARSTVTSSASERLHLIAQRLLTRENLLEIIKRVNLYADRPDLTLTEKVEKMRESTLIEGAENPFISARARRNMVTVSTFTISFEADRATQAAKVANEFVTMVIERNLQSRSMRASETNDFFKQEVERLAVELLAIEGQITAYKHENDAALPGSLEFRRAEFADLGERMFEREQRRFGLEEAKRTLEQALITGEDTPVEGQLTEDEKLLRNLERTYAEQSAIYAESHPVMRRMATRIKLLRQSISPATAGGDSASLRGAEITQKIKLIDTQLTLHTQQRAVDELRKATLEASIAKTPDVEMGLNALNRSYSDLQFQYQQAVLKQVEAETGEKLEINRQSESFEIIEQARVPDEPDAPNRPLIAVGGLFGSAALGVVLVVLAEMLDTAIRTPGDLERRLGLRPVVTIPYIRTAAEIHRRRLRIAGVVLAVLVIVPGGLFALDKYYLPLPLLVERLLDQAGLDSVLQIIARRF
jgi:uncharacterized protein involved in exopolysaccharide biosynthesis